MVLGRGDRATERVVLGLEGVKGEGEEEMMMTTMWTSDDDDEQLCQIYINIQLVLRRDP